MLALRKLQAGPGLALQEVPEPAPPQAGELLLAVEAAGICGSDLHLDAWAPGVQHVARHLPVTLGHEFAGRVLALGPDTEGPAPGTRVAVLPGVACQRCLACLRGEPAACARRQAIGVTRDGGFAPRVCVPAANCVVLPDGLEPALAALLEPLGIGDNAAQVGEIGFGDTVVVLGPGTIGQAACRAAAWRGAAAVVAVGFRDAPRLAVARAVGATHALDLADEAALPDALQRLLGRRQVDKVIEATGAAASLGDGLAVLRDGGIYVSVGIHQQAAALDMNAVVRRRLQIRGAYSSTRRSWEALARRIAADPASVRPMLSRLMPLAEGTQAFALCHGRALSKVVLLPQATPASTTTTPGDTP
ncbi:zinc-dependent alcohol dehydrogenase [Pseudorhodoferax sp.]|uniref:zinc-dependent alcohol dehydrogenase n=1 Tax=Pseudorhodoferax sp. TaxID=1993553 RepID=UPI002DD6A233|nr:alcohol dehydrogenase catalytic domain-containing protein [Pseudorhodoferax sp.]